ncbi:putative Non-ribosomal peptide synthetase module [Vibrio nigripulchritudo SO65]|uniref:amino acid adenylation domain-containing protein n=1 Tax=Vibrio nigripulchritudo TaxID=28173 RepID=UPI0003B23259|nr:amino acid adenylation domain-containing protein [Vibrio nigripulchritudo]CCN36972.1 putative Non-ribosomal peptide synthetase module [Vibrio nigripulchritudo AM115]CCN41806.1 putative Non-ribosomal peptide synthetase module [Vibrio nigripulchritudo FTn2]CCN66400.1 putative Non-ribosomal peptide synthetase module [Vibrio nigripulchritudo POn4]CCN74493.1 putative Non-ribosomal peptide synthetase module [Vibrio nigripulchritudo SO65]
MKELTTIQAAYLVGRQSGQSMGGVAAHIYAEFDGENINEERLALAVTRLYAGHSMLRMKITPEGQQTISPLSSIHKLVVDNIEHLNSEDTESFLLDKRATKTDQKLDLENGQCIEISATFHSKGQCRLHIDVDMIAVDAQSFRILVEELAKFYTNEQSGNDAPQGVPFFEYLERQAADKYLVSKRKEDKKWWQERLESVADAPAFPYVSENIDRQHGHSQRFTHLFTPDERASIESLAKTHRLTQTQLFLTLFSQAIGSSCNAPDFRLNVPTFHRGFYEGDVDAIIGDFSNLLIYSASLKAQESTLNHCRRTANQLNQLLSHEHYSGVALMRDLSRHHGTVQASPVVFTSGLDFDGDNLFTDAVTKAFGKMNWVISQGAQVTLDAQIAPAYDGIFVNWDVRMDVFPEGFVQTLFDKFLAIVRSLAANPESIHLSLELTLANLGFDCPSLPLNSASPKPLTELQKSYLLGRSTQIPMGGTAMHEFREYRGKIDSSLVESRLKLLVKKFDALRTHIDEHKLLQHVSAKAVLNFHSHDLRHLSIEQSLEEIETIRVASNHAMHDLSRSPWSVSVIQLPESELDYQTVVFTSFDALIVDGRTHSLILSELLKKNSDQLQEISTNQTPVSNQETEKDNAKKLADETYWENKLNPECAPPSLPWKQRLENIKASRYQRESIVIEKSMVTQLTMASAANSLFLNSALSALILEGMSYWTTEQEMRVGFPVAIPQNDRPLGNDSTFVILEYRKNEGTLLDRARSMQSDMLEALDHLDFSGVDINRQLMSTRSTALALPVVVTNGLAWDTLSEEDDLVFFSGVTQTPQVALDIRLNFDESKNLVLSFDYAVDALDKQVVVSILASIERHVQALCETKNFDIASHKVVNLDHYKLNCDESEFECSKFLAKIAKNVGENASSDIAVICGDRQISYKAFGEDVHKVMQHISHLGLKQGDVLAICMPKSPEHLVMTIACSLSGIIWVPIDASSPEERLGYLLSNCNANLVVTRQPSDRANSVTYESLLQPVDKTYTLLSNDELEALSKSEQGSYYLYTSGTTGKPKCVVVNSRATSNVVGETCKAWEITSDDVLMCVTPFHHDLSVFDIYASFATGATIVLPAMGEEKDAIRWNQLVEQHGITIWQSVPALMEMLLSCMQGEKLKSLRLVCQGGDYVKPKTIQELRALEQDIRMVSIGGPTETTIWSVWHFVTDEDITVIPYGRPFPANQYFIMDGLGKHVPQGVVGRIMTVGVNLASGYLEDGELKQTDFVTIVDDKGDEVRAFRTGDLGYYREDGNIIFAGRVNGYVKVRGVRVSLPDVEKELNRCPTIEQVLIVDYTERNGDIALGAIYTVAEGQSASAVDIRDFAQQCLPNSHVPSQLLELEKLPLSRNGKFDRIQARELLIGSINQKESVKQPELNVASGTVSQKNRSIDTLDHKRIIEVYEKVIGKHQDGFDEGSLFLSLGLKPSHLKEIATQLNHVFGSKIVARKLIKCRNAKEVGKAISI